MTSADATPQPAHPPAPALELAVWEYAGLMLTYWCSSRCAFCYVHAGPHRGEDMSVETAIALWHSLDHLAAAHGKTMRIHLAGGEPFRDWVVLVAIIRAARDAGLTPLEKVETNASWATSDGRTRSRLELLAALGTERLVVSSDVFHQEFVPFDRVRRCVETARRVFGRGRVMVRWWDFYQQPLDTRGMTPRDK
ncbi:MAG: radical SAM protein, partial [Planctomycetes bacterium]|nr:radical SAM protein [Planctomycetota bacterium]